MLAEARVPTVVGFGNSCKTVALWPLVFLKKTTNNLVSTGRGTHRALTGQRLMMTPADWSKALVADPVLVAVEDGDAGKGGLHDLGRVWKWVRLFGHVSELKLKQGMIWSWAVGPNFKWKMAKLDICI